MKRKSFVVLTTLLAAATLAGCQNNASKRSDANKQSSVSLSKAKGSSNSSSKRTFGGNSNNSSNATSSTWDSTKQDKLDDFFDDWAKTMDQTYEKYDGSGQIKTAAGEEFPKDFDRVAVNGSKVSMSYSPNGKGDSDYNVVAIYNYDKDQGASHITYFFAFHNGQPIVLVDETTNGDTVEAKETENKDLINGFNDIAAGKDATMSDSDSDSNESEGSEDPKLVGVFVGLLKSGDWFKHYLKEGHMYFGTDWDSGEIHGYDYITANGDPTSYFWYKQNGDTVTIKYVDMSNSDSVASAPIKTEKISLSRLKSDYYVSSSQKAEVDGYVKKVKPVSAEDDE